TFIGCLPCRGSNPLALSDKANSRETVVQCEQMTLTMELSDELTERLQRAAARGQKLADYARMVLETAAPVDEEALSPERRRRMEKNRRVIALLDQWDAEDAADPEPGPIPEVEPLRLRVFDPGY